MPVSLDEILKKLGAARRKKIQASAASIITEEMSLRELHLGITSDVASRVEKRDEVKPPRRK
jgi:hypothetical protein